MMATVELDPDFSKGLRLMFSSAKDSTEQLRAMLEEAIRAKHGTSRSLGNIPTVKDDDEMCIVLERESDESASDKEEEDDEIAALEMMDLSCSICKDMSVAPGNRLVECCECQELYHQECHKPTILDKEVDDPRKTWYCSSCKQATEAAKPPSSKSSSSSSGSTGSKSLRSSPSLRDSPTNLKATPAAAAKTETASLFKRSDKLSSGSSPSSSSGSSKPSGLAAMAASLQSSKSSSSSTKSSVSGSGKGTSSPAKSSSSGFSSSGSKTSSSSSSSSSKISGFTGVPSPTSSSAADKRLQNMKKKAASKLQEKRKHAK